MKKISLSFHTVNIYGTAKKQKRIFLRWKPLFTTADYFPNILTTEAANVGQLNHNSSTALCKARDQHVARMRFLGYWHALLLLCCLVIHNTAEEKTVKWNFPPTQGPLATIFSGSVQNAMVEKNWGRKSDYHIPFFLACLEGAGSGSRRRKLRKLEGDGFP